SDISYANYLKSIAEEITLKDDRLDEYHKKCVNELNIIKEDFNNYFINLRNKLVRDYQILRNNKFLYSNSDNNKTKRMNIITLILLVFLILIFLCILYKLYSFFSII
ncbi:hypothetical protein TCON_2346, partial [Astathelohania contejeani]